MPWYVGVFIAYIIFDRAGHLWLAGRGETMEFTGGTAVFSLITGALMIWMVAHLVGMC